jgi:tRNA(fMet)-specific endonuclease VapC
LTVLVDPPNALHAHLRQRLEQPDAVGYAITVVNLQEQMRGRLASIHRATKADKVLRAYDGLMRTFARLKELEVLPYDAAAHARFESLRPQLRRLGTMDLRIACIALTRDATLLTRNLRDFRQVPGLRVEDRSRAA